MQRKITMGRIMGYIGLLGMGMVWGVAWGEPVDMGLSVDSQGTSLVDWKGLEEGIGREDVFYTCQACHSLMLVKQQHLSRERWQEVLALMVKEKGLVEPLPEVKERLLDYLSTHFGPPSGSATGLGSMPPPLSGIRP